jgi:peptidoglycan/LPS O-acetylase OafA/YrhL
MLLAPSATTPSSERAAEPFRLGYRPALDGLRATAALMVMSFHFHVPGWPGGFLGVDVFFVLSGFLITSLLLEEWRNRRSIDLRRFYARRALRLLPALVLLLIICGPFVGIAWTFATLGYIVNWLLAFQIFHFSPLSHVWSLSVEEQFYLVWPFFLLTLLRSGLARWAILATTIVLGAGSAALKITSWSEQNSWFRLYHGSDARADALLVGCAIGMLLAWGWLPRQAWFNRMIQVAALAGLLGLAALSTTANIDSRFLYRDGVLTLVALSAGAIILSLVVCPIHPLAAVLEWSPLVAIGRISYGLYLWHHPISWIPSPLGTDLWSQIITIGLRMALSFAAAIASYHLVEKPTMHLKRKLWLSSRVSMQGQAVSAKSGMN